MVEIITDDVSKSDLKGVVSKLLPDAIAKDIEKACQGIYPLHDVYIRKVSAIIFTMSIFNESNTHIILGHFLETFNNFKPCNET